MRKHTHTQTHIKNFKKEEEEENNALSTWIKE
jgi:hypothetical protein